MAEKKDKIVIAFDIGTRTTGCLFSLKEDPLKIMAIQFIGSRDIAMRAPTSVLVDDQKQFVAFGLEAEDMYANLDKESKDKGWALFRRFKEQINQLTSLNIHDTEIVDISRKIRVPAIKLFEMVIRYLKGKAVAYIESRLGIMDDIGYVITVPEFCLENLRCMVRYAADKAGIARDRLQLIQESDAATIWCHNDPDLMVPELQNPGTKYIVVNMGGGFSNCKFVSDVLAAEFPEKKIVCPQDGEFSAAKGAVISRHLPGVLVREARFTYGRSEHVLFDKKLHSGQHKRDIGGELWCTEVFRKYVTKGEVIPYDYEITDTGLLPMEGQRLHATCSFYISVNESPQFVSDPGCQLVGDPFTHRFPHEQELPDRAYDLTLRFLFEEIRVTFYHRKSGLSKTETFFFV